VKYIRIYLSGANNAPCFVFHNTHCYWIAWSIMHVFFVDLLETKAFMLSTEPVPKAGKVEKLQAVTWLAL
jgi:hypothetical protein